MDPDLYRELLPLLDSPVKRGEQTWSYCPTHPDGSTKRGKGGLAGRSLSLHPQYGLECWSNRGCTFKGILDALRAKKGGRRDNNRPAPAVKAESGRKWAADGMTRLDGFRLVEAYDYGAAVKGRFERANPEAERGYEKEFAWRLREGTFAKGISPLRVVDMPLWGEELIADAPADARIWFTEGEKAAKVLRERGEIAVCAAWGASQKEFPSERWEPLRDRLVLLWPDNDVAGREYMLAVRKALRGIARSVVTVHAAVPPKGDAYEWFVKQKGSVEQLLQGVVLGPSVEVIAADAFTVRVPTEAGVAVFAFAEMVRARHALEAELTVEAPQAESEPYRQRINVLSQSAREGLERALGRQFGRDVNWTVAVSVAYSRAVAAYESTDAGVHVSALPEVSEQRWLIENMVPFGHPTIVFGDGSSGKSLLAEDWALSVALGTASWCGYRVQYGGVLWLDYETDGDEGETFRVRLRRLLEGRGLDAGLIEEPDFRIHYWRGRGIPLADQAEAIGRYMARHDLDLLVVDSGGIAAGGKPEDAVVALGYFAGLAKVGKTSVTICHVSKEEAKGQVFKPFGSVYWHNLARRTWWVTRKQEEESDDMALALFNRKANYGALSRPVGVKFRFSGPAGPIVVRRDSARAAEMMVDPLADRIREFLEAEGAQTPAEIVRVLGEPGPAVADCLRRWDGRGFVIVSDGPGPVRWGSMAWRREGEGS